MAMNFEASILRLLGLLPRQVSSIPELYHSYNGLAQFVYSLDINVAPNDNLTITFIDSAGDQRQTTITFSESGRADCVSLRWFAPRQELVFTVMSSHGSIMGISSLPVNAEGIFVGNLTATFVPQSQHDDPADKYHRELVL